MSPFPTTLAIISEWTNAMAFNLLSISCINFSSYCTVLKVRTKYSLYKKVQGPIFSQHGPKQAGLIRDSLHDWKSVINKKSSAITDWKVIENFKRAILIKTWLVWKGKESSKKKKTNMFVTTKELSRVVKWDHLRQYPVQYYWTGNNLFYIDIWMVDFSYWPSQLT